MTVFTKFSRVARIRGANYFFFVTVFHVAGHEGNFVHSQGVARVKDIECQIIMITSKNITSLYCDGDFHVENQWIHDNGNHSTGADKYCLR